MQETVVQEHMEDDSLVVLSPFRKSDNYLYEGSTSQQVSIKSSSRIVNKAISKYQTPYYLYKHQGLKL